jgi:hypothetical protein
VEIDLDRFAAFLVSIFFDKGFRKVYSLFSPVGMKFSYPPFVRAKNQISAPIYTDALISPPPIDQFHMVILEGELKGLRLKGWAAGLVGDELGEVKRLQTLPEGKTEREYLFEAEPDIDVSAAIGCEVEIIISFFEGLRGKRWPVRLRNVVTAQGCINNG